MPNRFELKRTETNTFTIVLYTNEDQDTRLNATGYTVRFFAKSSRSLSDADAEIRKDNGGIGGIVLQTGGGTPNSEAIITISPADMVAMPNEYVILEYVCQLKAPDGNISVADHGEIEAQPVAMNAI